MIIAENELNSQNFQEFESLLKEYQKLNASRVIEIGSLYGWALQHFIHYSQQGSTVLAIDLPVRNFVGPFDWRVEKQEKNYKEVWPQWAKTNKTKLFLIPDISQKQETLNKTKEIFNNKEIDFLFIDGDHTYNGVKQDYKMYGPLVRKGGIIAFHDIGLNEEGGVYNLWNEIKSTKKEYKEFLFEKNNEKGIGLLYV
jgi:cephalosporin hydroxylase